MSQQPQTNLQALVGIEKIVSGGQTGVDRAALDFAIEKGIMHGGWCPNGRLAEDGLIPVEYLLVEMESSKYADRTKRNVLDSDGTLVLSNSYPEGGTLLTVNYAMRCQKPCLKVRLCRPPRPDRVHAWIRQNNIRILNIAGPRASKQPDVYDKAFRFLTSVFADSSIAFEK
jgi:Circularly permutated YpsA SLOG family